MSFADKQLTFGGAGPGTPWGTLGEITARVLAPLGYQVRVEPEASRGRCPGLVSAGKLEFGGEPGYIPYRLLRGVEAPVRSVYRPWQLIFGRDDMPDEFAYQLAQAYDQHRDAFRQTHIPYSYDPDQVARDHGIPLHPGAERYYRERGYLTGA